MEKSNNLLPVSIIIAALLIAGAWIYTAGTKNVDQAIDNKKMDKEVISNIENVKSVSVNDHIRGNPEAKVKIVEFSDLECPFCKVFHETMKQAAREYDGKVAWIYRHYPLDQLHPVKARKAAVASECAAKLGGNEGFWKYIDRYFEITPSNNQINLNELPKIAAYVGLNVSQFNTCLESGEYDSLIEEQVRDATNSGAQGTPYSVIIAADNSKYEINGALPMDNFEDQYGKMQKGVRTFIEEALIK